MSLFYWHATFCKKEFHEPYSCNLYIYTTHTHLQFIYVNVMYLYILCIPPYLHTYVWNWAAHIFSIFLSHMSKVKPNINSKWNIYFFVRDQKFFTYSRKEKEMKCFRAQGWVLCYIHEKLPACVNEVCCAASGSIYLYGSFISFSTCLPCRRRRDMQNI